MEDFGPVGLTSCIIEVFEKYINSITPHINKLVNFLDPYPYVYKAKRHIDGAVIRVLNNIYIYIYIYIYICTLRQPEASIRLCLITCPAHFTPFNPINCVRSL